MTLLEWIKANAKEGTKIEEAESLIKDLDPLKNIKTNDEALAFIERNKVFKAALDAETTRRVDKHDEKYQSEKLPDLLKAEREKTIAELNPEEDPKDKRIRELEDKDKQRDRKDAENSLKDHLRSKANELKYDPLRAEKLYIYGDKAEEMLEKEVDFLNTTINKGIEKGLKEKYTTNDPKRNNTDPAKIMTRADHDILRQSDPVGAAKFFQDGGKLED